MPEYYFDSVVRSGLFAHMDNTFSGIALFLDYDGTLVPIRRHPSQCFPAKGLKDKLRRLAGRKEMCIAVLSGRDLRDVRKRVGIRRIIYGGSHGLEISTAGFSFTHTGAREATPIIAAAKRILEHEFRSFEGVWIEDKKYALSLHYRCVRTEDVGAVKRTFSEAVAGFTKNDALSVVKGKKVLDLKPAVSWNKGKAALMILDLIAGTWLPVVIGDDLTDETVFEALAERGVTIRVGRSSKTFARYYLKNQGEVEKVLDGINETIEHYCRRVRP